MKFYVGFCVFIFCLAAIMHAKDAAKKQSASDAISAVINTLLAAAGLALLIKYSV